MHRWHVVLVWAVVVVVGEVDLSSADPVVEEHQVTAGRDTPLAWPACFTEGRRRRAVDSDDEVATGDEQFRYAVVVDAGSSGSRVRVYRWPTPVGGARVALEAPGVKEIHSKKIEPGLSAHATDLQRVSDDIRGLLRNATGYVPRPQQRTSPVYVMATAGQSVQFFIVVACGGEPLTPNTMIGVEVVRFWSELRQTRNFMKFNWLKQPPGACYRLID